MVNSNYKTAIVLHLYYQDLWPEFKEKILPVLSDDTHLYVSINERNEYTEDIEKYSKEVFLVENRGMDFGPFVFIYNKIRSLNYKYIVKLHGKKSLHSPGLGDYWRTTLVNSIINSADHFYHIINFMENDSDIFMASSSEFYYDTDRESINHPNRLAALSFINKVRNFTNSGEHGCFFAGSMFIVTTNYLEKLFANADLIELYEQFELGYSMDSFAHGMERVIGYGVIKNNGKYLTI
jgi:lipopolysaccharide biosynthesis protein